MFCCQWRITSEPDCGITRIPQVLILHGWSHPSFHQPCGDWGRLHYQRLCFPCICTVPWHIVTPVHYITKRAGKFKCKAFEVRDFYHSVICADSFSKSMILRRMLNSISYYNPSILFYQWFVGSQKMASNRVRPLVHLGKFVIAWTVSGFFSFLLGNACDWMWMSWMQRGFSPTAPLVWHQTAHNSIHSFLRCLLHRCLPTSHGIRYSKHIILLLTSKIWKMYLTLATFSFWY